MFTVNDTFHHVIAMQEVVNKLLGSSAILLLMSLPHCCSDKQMSVEKDKEGDKRSLFDKFTHSLVSLCSLMAKELEEKVDLKGRMAAPRLTPPPTASSGR